jgi:large subunit ribosomal protein L18
MPRYKLTISRSLKHISGQVADPNGKIVASATSKTQPASKLTDKTKTQISAEVGKELAEKLKAKKVSELWFDRKGKRYHGRIAKLIETLRKEGIRI